MSLCRRATLGAAATLWLVLAGCGTDDETGSPDLSQDTGTDVADDAIADAPPADVGGDGDDDATDLTGDGDDLGAPDAVADANDDVTVAGGTIRGSVFNNTGTGGGVLRVGLFTDLPVSGEPVRVVAIDGPLVPVQPYELTGVPVGSYYVAAILDRDDPNTFEAPGAEDLFGVTPGLVGIESDVDVRAGINVEVQ